MPPAEIAPLLERVSARLRAGGGDPSDIDGLIADRALWEVVGRWPPDAGSIPPDARILEVADRLDRARRMLPPSESDSGLLRDAAERLRFACMGGGSIEAPPSPRDGDEWGEGSGGGFPHRSDLDSDIVGPWPPE